MPSQCLIKRFALVLLLAFGSLSQAVDPLPIPPPPASPFLGIAYRYADTLLEHGRDTYGPQKTGLFLSALDRTTLAPLTSRPAPPAGIRREDRSGTPWMALVGANPHLDENLLRVLYTLTALSNNKKYKDAADNELKWFLENTASPVTHLLPWGEHMFWDVMEDKPRTGMSGEGGGPHEFSRPWVLWDQCFELAPKASEQFALGLWENQIADHKTGGYDRHAAFDKHGPVDGKDFARHAGFYIRTWAVAYAHTRNKTFLTAIEVLLQRFEKKRDPNTGLIEFTRGNAMAAPLLSLSLAIDCAGAADDVPEPLASRLRAFADREDEVFCGLPHDLKGKCGFVDMLDKKTGKLLEKSAYTPLWGAQYGGPTTAAAAMMCVARYENTGKVSYRELIHAAADCYLNTLPGEDEDTWPITFGHAISLELAAWRSSAKRVYFDRARELGTLAVQKFWQDNPLPKASYKTGHYEAITGADTLALALVELHLNILHITAVRCPANTIDR